MIVLLAHHLFETYKSTDFTKFVSTIIVNMEKAKLLAKEVILQWADKQIDDKLEQHFLFSADNNNKLRDNAAQAVQFLKKRDQEEEEEESGQEEDDEAEEEGEEEDGEEEEGEEEEEDKDE